jgi:site-specific DNA-methyltransferase (adenine-specific)
MPQLPDTSIDLILCDLPYGTTACSWDTIIPFDLLWKQYRRIIKDNGTIVLFGTQPFTSKLILSNTDMFKYCWYWNGGRAANFAQAPYMPLKNIEDVVVFSKATIAQNSKNRMKYYPLGLSDTSKIHAGKKANDHRPNRTTQDDWEQTQTGYPFQLIYFGKEVNPVHPTQKPVDLCEYLILTYTEENDLVLDNCAGSGSTLVAAKKTKRHYIGIELEPKYVEICNYRLEQTQEPMF